MELNLKELQTLKIQGKKEFSFIRPLTEYISENYGEIENELEISHLKEIITEVRSENKLSLMTYVKQDSIEPISPTFSNYAKSEKDGKTIGIENICFREGYYATRSIERSISELYYISDEKAYILWLEECRQEKVKKEIERKEIELKEKIKSEEELKVKIADDMRIREKFKLDAKADTTQAELFESLFQSKDLNEQFNSFKKLISIVEEGVDYDYIREIAREEARYVMEDY